MYFYIIREGGLFMKVEEFKQFTTQIAQANGDQGKITEILTNLNDKYENFYNTHESLESQSKEHLAKIDSLQKTNMQLFLRTAQPTDPAGKIDTTEELTYDKLLDEMIK
jgi:hypothetical protein